MALKFDDCSSCKFRRTRTCGYCDFGEFYENEEEGRELSFDDEDAAFNRADNSLTTDDDEPFHNPDDYVHQLDTFESEEEIEDDDEDI
jgi:hypothetical protein